MLVFEEREKPEYPEKNLSEQGREPTTNSTHIRRRVGELHPGHTGGRRVLSPLRCPCCPHYCNYLTRCYIHTYIHSSIHPSLHPSIHPSIHPSMHAYSGWIDKFKRRFRTSVRLSVRPSSVIKRASLESFRMDSFERQQHLSITKSGNKT